MAKDWHQKQRERGVKLILTWFGPRNCWKKYRAGETKYFHHPNSAAGYEAAVAEYHAWLHWMRDSRALADEYRHHVGILQQCIDWYDRFGVPDDEAELQSIVTEVRDRLKVEVESGEELSPISECLPDGSSDEERQFLMTFCEDGIVDHHGQTNGFDSRFGSLGWSPNGVWAERLRQLAELDSHHRKAPQTVGHQVQRFLDFKERQARAGVITPRTWGTLAERLAYFLEWIKPGTHVSTIDGTTVTNFYEWVLSQRTWGHQRARNIFNTGRQWIRWAWRQDDVELEQLPKNINSREFVFLSHLDSTGISRKTRTDMLWSPEEFKQTFENVPEDFQLILLLMLNCGFTNEDVAVLLKSEVRLEEGRIVRQRGKTRRHAQPPLVNYKLWPKTHELLRKCWSEHPTVVLINQRGKPLSMSKLVKRGDKTVETVWSGIGRRYGQLKKASVTNPKKPALPDKQLKFLRKTGSSKIRSNREFLSLDSLYLGHSWATVADKHYNAFDGQPYTPLDEAIDWLGSEFGQMPEK